MRTRCLQTRVMTLMALVVSVTAMVVAGRGTAVAQDACASMTAATYDRVRPTAGAELMTQWATEAGTAARLYGFTEDRGTLVRVARVSAPGLVGVHRLYQATSGDFVYVTDAAEVASAVNVYGYVDQGAVFHASPSASACTVPVLRFRRGGVHRLALSAESAAMQSAGWTYEKVAFHAAPAATSGPATYFGWVGVGQPLPSDAECAAAVRPAPEVRRVNDRFNVVTWGPWSATYPRATGSFTGTTDEIIQWAACKWGFDEDTLRAQVARESYWAQSSLGDWTTDGSTCAPNHGLGVDGRPGQCPQSVGLMQVRTPYFRDAIHGAVASSSYNVDVALAIWRRCFEGGEQWLNRFERGWDYAAGDAWGCIGRWYSGRWHTPEAEGYISRVREWLQLRIWTTEHFLTYNGPPRCDSTPDTGCAGPG